jgi:hypothetical protein
MANTRPACRYRPVLLMYLALIPALAGASQDEKKGEKQDEKKEFTITPTRTHGNVFGGEEIEFKFRLDAAKAVKGRLAWRLALGTATIKSGEAALVAEPSAPADVVIKLPPPEIKDGAVLNTKLTLSAFDDAQAQPIVTFEQDLWVFPKDPFADRGEWLKKLQINLYDPKGDTAKVLTAMKVPFEELRSVDSLADLKEGLVLIGEGVSFKDEKGLAVELQKRAAAGLLVLVLAPAGGAVFVPGIGNPGGVDNLSFRRDIIRKLDKRLDPDDWPPDGKAIASTVAIKIGDRGEVDDGVVGEVAIGADGWPWIEARYGTGRGRWTFCGLAVIAKWEAGPTPRFLFLRMLEYLTDPGSE